MSEQLTLESLIGHICRRPRMFAHDGTFRTAATFIDGFACGQASTGLEPPTGELRETQLDRFRSWLALRCYESHDMPRNLVWWGYIVRLFPADDDAFLNLPVLFAEFLAEEQAEGTPADGDA